jgi:hypothetical protein
MRSGWENRLNEGDQVLQLYHAACELTHLASRPFSSAKFHIVPAPGSNFDKN